MNRRNLILRFLSKVDIYISVAGLAALVLLTFFGTFARYLFNTPFVWQEEIQMILMVWIVFWGASAAFRTQNHIAIEILTDALPAKAQYAVRAVVDVIVTVALLFIMGVECSRVMQLAASGRSTSILKIPQAYNYSGVVLACVFMLVNFLAVEVRYFQGAKRGDEGR